jgi:hypothetical protein
MAPILLRCKPVTFINVAQIATKQILGPIYYSIQK